MNIVDWAVSVIEDLGGVGVALLLFLENLFPPIPSEVILPLAGVVAGRGQEHYLVILAWTVVGAVAGAQVLYAAGRWMGPERVRRIFAAMPLVEAEDFDQTVAWFERHGTWGVFLGRMVPGVRSLISIPAGVYRMPWPVFMLLTVAGTLIWNTIFVTLGYFLGDNWHVIEPWTDVLSWIVYAIIGALLLWFVISRLLRIRRRRRGQG